jgi:hypothetical protein
MRAALSRLLQRGTTRTFGCTSASDSAMTRETAKEKTKVNSPGYLTHLVVYGAAVTVMYYASTPEVTGNFTERQERDFHIAAVRQTKAAEKASYAAFSLAQLRAGKVDLASVSFLLPQGDIKIDVPGADLHKVTVIERHPDWELVEYQYGNSHDSISRYRAFRDRVEPVSYRITMDMGLFFSALVLLIPAVIVSALINALWKRVARRRKASNGA